VSSHAEADFSRIFFLLSFSTFPVPATAMKFHAAVVALAALVTAQANELQSFSGSNLTRELQSSICGGIAPCAAGASCIGGTCVCKPGYVPDPSIPDQDLAPYFSCLDVDECTNEYGSTNVCAPVSEGGVCVDYDPPIRYRCFCAAGFQATSVDPTYGPTGCEGVTFFKRVASFPTCSQFEASCNTNTESVAEIVAASADGNTLIYTDSASKKVGFIDITTPSSPVALGTVNLAGEPTSVATKGNYALVAVDTSSDFVNPSGILNVINIATRTVVRMIDLGGQPDSIAVSPDGKYAAIAIENQRDEDLGDGAPPQLPAGFLVVVDMLSSDPATWTTSDVKFVGLTGLLYPSDPEPEFVSINSANIAAVTCKKKCSRRAVQFAHVKLTLCC
jgi:hypothetical protein